MASLVRGDSRERDRLVLAHDPLQRIVRDRDVRRRLEVVEGEAVFGGDHLRSRDTLHLAYGAKSLRVQTSTPAGCFVIVPIFVPTIECMFISDAMSRIRCVMMPSKTTARVCFALLSVPTSSRTGTSVTTPSPSSRRRAVEEPPSCRRMSRYFSSFGLRTFVVGVRVPAAVPRGVPGALAALAVPAETRASVRPGVAAHSRASAR